MECYFWIPRVCDVGLRAKWDVRTALLGKKAVVHVMWIEREGRENGEICIERKSESWTKNS